MANAIITGAGRGIGRATAVLLARHGWRLALAARSAAELAETAGLAPGSIAIPTDVTRSGEVDQLVATALERLGSLDAVVHCAGVAPAVAVEAMSDEQWRAAIDTNLSAAFYLARAAWPAMKSRGGGVLVNISSLAARDPLPGFAAYGAAKAGVNLLGLMLAREGEPWGIRVHTLGLGAVETSMFRALVSREQYPPQNTMSPEEVAEVILQCVRGDLRHTSGEVIYLHQRV